MFGFYSAAFMTGTVSLLSRLHALTEQTIAPILGGALSTPADRYAIFSNSELLKRYPFALPGLVAGLSTLTMRDR